MKRITWASLLALVSILIAGCVDTTTPSTKLQITSEDVAPIGGYLDLMATGGLDYHFSVTGGAIIHQDGGRAVWETPLEPGTYSVKVESEGKTVIKSVKVVTAPAYTLDWTLVDDGIGGKNARIVVWNASDKPITAVRVRIVMWNNFGERVTHFGSYHFNGQASDIYIAPNGERTSTWSLYWASGVTNIAAWVYEVAFADGTTWSLYKD